MNVRTIRMIGLGAAVVIAACVPLAASAGQAGNPPGGAPDADSRPGSSQDPGLLGMIGAPRPGASAPAAGASEGPAAAAARSSRCGPELTSPDGIEAQTCVMTGSGDTWGRTYFRNATGEALTAVLTLMGPGGRTVQTQCAVAAGDEPGVCETPRERSQGRLEAYTAVAEFAGAGEGAETPLLLRVGSNGVDAEVS
ncbi:hypothetical protein ACH44C_10855 [Streptomyces purpureus]|uniref:hypothetical protein n=1 Tax=Streptomyces purpureus TaxID=1951 RepID=UPI00379E5FCB